MARAKAARKGAGDSPGWSKSRVSFNILSELNVTDVTRFSLKNYCYVFLLQPKPRRRRRLEQRREDV